MRWIYERDIKFYFVFLVSLSHPQTHPSLLVELLKFSEEFQITLLEGEE